MPDDTYRPDSPLPTLGTGSPYPDYSARQIDSDPYLQEINDLLQLHESKKADYANADNQFSNFEASSKYAGVSVDEAFDVLIGTKIARLQNLKESGKHPMNESVQDTERDLSNYIIIKRAYRRWVNSKKNSDVRKGIEREVNAGKSFRIP